MLKNLTIKSMLIFVIGFLSLLLIGSGIVGLSSLRSSNVSLKTIYEDRLVPLTQLDAVIRLIDKNRMTIAESMNGDPAVVTKRMDEIDKRNGEVKKNWEAFMSSNLTDEAKKLAAQSL